MNDLTVSILALLGTLAGSMGGVVASSRLTNFRLKKLEEKMDKHNQLIGRTYVLEEKLKSVCGRIEQLEFKGKGL